MRSSLFWEVTQRRLVGTHALGQPLGPETSVTTNQRRVTSQKSEDLTLKIFVLTKLSSKEI